MKTEMGILSLVTEGLMVGDSFVQYIVKVKYTMLL